MKLNIIEFTVEGRGAFPLDMLRYDNCWPARAEDVSNIGESASSGLIRQITLRAAVWQKLPTVARWKSFGWNVLESRKL